MKLFKWIPQQTFIHPKMLKLIMTSGKNYKMNSPWSCSDTSQLSDIKGHSIQFQTNSQRFNRLEMNSNSFVSSSGGNNIDKDIEKEKDTIIKYIDELKYSDLRDNALLELSRQREHF